MSKPLSKFHSAVLSEARPTLSAEVLDWLDGCGLEAAHRLMTEGFLAFDGNEWRITKEGETWRKANP